MPKGALDGTFTRMTKAEVIEELRACERRSTELSEQSRENTKRVNRLRKRLTQIEMKIADQPLLNQPEQGD